MAEKVGVNTSLPRICRRQTNRQNTPAATPEQYFKRTISIPVVDNVSNQMRDRFLNMRQLAVMGQYFIPSTFLEDPAMSQNDVYKFAEEYREVLRDPSLLGHRIFTILHCFVSLISCIMDNLLISVEQQKNIYC